MKTVDLKRTISVPDNDFCIMWNNQKEVCPQLAFRKEPNFEKIMFKCNFYDIDLIPNINSFGIEKYCMIHKKGKVYKVTGEKLK